LAKVGLDGHDVGILVLAKRLQEAGFEVIYLGKRNRPQDVAYAAVQEDVGIVGVSSLSGAAGALASAVVRSLREFGSDTPVIAGGIAEPEEVAAMIGVGVRAFFGPEHSLDDVVAEFERASQRGV
jgi:methylmalonyl-CoA mutase C-terminal domain/subunit